MNLPHRSRLVLIGIAILIGLLVPAGSALAQQIRYVRTSGNDSNNGLTPATAWRSVTKASTSAPSGANIVYIGAGSYSGKIEPTVDGAGDTEEFRFVADTTGAYTGDAGTVTLTHGSGALVIENDSDLIFEGFTISSNNEVVQIKSGEVRLKNCIINQTANKDTILIENSGHADVWGCTINAGTNNGIRIAQGSASVQDTSVTNASGSGKAAFAIEISGSSLTLDRVTVSSSRHAVRALDGTVTVRNALFTNMSGDAFYQQNSTASTIWHATISGVSGDAIETQGGTLTVQHSIFHSTTGFGIRKVSGTITNQYNLYNSNTAGMRSGQAAGTGEISGNPLFVSASNWQLQAASPAISAGVASGAPSVDLLSNPRPMGAARDLGAYEYLGITPGTVPYFTDFQSGIASSGPWLGQTTTTTAGLTTFSGPFTDTGLNDEAQTLSLTVTPGQLYYLIFDAYILDGWNGLSSVGGPDYLRVEVNGTAILTESFSQTLGTQLSARLPDLAGTSRGGSAGTDLVYRKMYATFIPSTSSVLIRFEGDITATDESWGIDNVRVVDSATGPSYLPRFSNITASTNFGVTSGSTFNSPGAPIFADLDADGDLDALLTGNSTARRMINTGSSFTVSAFVASSAGGQAALLDAESDADLDLWAGFVSDANTERLFTNNALGTFTNFGGAGVTTPTNNEGLAAADVNLDGWCDLVMFSENSNWVLHNQASSTPAFVASSSSTYGFMDSGDWGNGDFASAADMNNDGRTDFFYHYGTGKLFRSDGDGTFTESTGGISVNVDSAEKFGSAWGDYDNDGDMDLFAARRETGQRPYLWRNNGNNTFTDVAVAAGLSETLVSSSGCWGDIDNDGDLDLYVVTADTAAHNVLYTNNGNGTFTIGAEAVGAWQEGLDAVFADYDTDGDLDLAITHENQNAILLRNGTNGNNYLLVRVLGKGAGGINRAGIGARVELLTSGGAFLQRREIGVARGMGAEPMWVHFGGVNPATSYQVRITYGTTTYTSTIIPAAVSTTIGSRTINQMYTFDESSVSKRVTQWSEVEPR